MIKNIRDLVNGDRVVMEDGGTATIRKVEKYSIVEAAPGNGGAYEVTYKNEAGEDCAVIVAGLDKVEIEENA